MHKVWQYHWGEWKEIDNPLPMPDGSDWEAEMKKAGFEQWYILGEQEYNPNIEVWWRPKDIRHTYDYQYFVLYSLSGNGGEDIWIPNLPDLLQFLRENAPAIQTQNVIEFNKLLRSGLEKTFHVWHEHPLEDICRHCDPFAYEMRQRRYREREEKRREAEAKKGAGNA